jgi:hypothetical protein
MKYLTKEWYELCQQTGMHFGMKVNNGAAVYDEALYRRLYKRKENEYIKSQHEFYDLDPCFMLEQDGSTYIPLHKLINGEEISEEDKLVYHMLQEERESIQKLIDEYEVRPPFDEIKCREEFRSFQETINKRKEKEIHTYGLTIQVPDIRVFSLGYCTREVLKQLKKFSKENEKEIKRVLSEYSKAQKLENIPQNISENFGFHDCKVTEFTVGKNVVMYFDTDGGFTDLNKITFVASDIIKQEDYILDSIWIYDELYHTEGGYEAHMLFEGEGMPELIIQCKDIIIEKE